MQRIRFSVSEIGVTDRSINRLNKIYSSTVYDLDVVLTEDQLKELQKEVDKVKHD